MAASSIKRDWRSLQVARDLKSFPAIWIMIFAPTLPVSFFLSLLFSNWSPMYHEADVPDKIHSHSFILSFSSHSICFACYYIPGAMLEFRE